MARTVAKLPDIVVGDTFTQVLRFEAAGRDWTSAQITSVLRKVTNLGRQLEYQTVKTFTPSNDMYAAPDNTKVRVVLDATSQETADWGAGQYSGTIVVTQDGFGTVTYGTYNFNIVTI